MQKKAPYVDNQELLSEALSKSLGVPRALMERADGIKCNSWLEGMPANWKIPNIDLLSWSSESKNCEHIPGRGTRQ